MSDPTQSDDAATDTEEALPADFLALQSEAGEAALAELGVRLLDEDDELFTHDYLSPENLARPDIAANIAAIDEVAELALWAVMGEEEDLWGWWLGPEQGSPVSAPVVRFDTEGQFLLMAGRDLATAIAVEYSWGEEETWQQIRESFAEAGIELPATLAEADVTPDVSPTPAEVHQQAFDRLYGEG